MFWHTDRLTDRQTGLADAEGLPLSLASVQPQSGPGLHSRMYEPLAHIASSVCSNKWLKGIDTCSQANMMGYG